jgi:uncharacterized protein (TIGR02597 family)
MRLTALAVAAALLSALIAVPAGATVMGYNKVVVPGLSDAKITVPFTEHEDGEFTADAVDSGTGVITVTADPALTPDEFAADFYVRFVDGDAEGLWSTIIANGTGSITVENPAVLAYAAAGDTLRVYKHHTVKTMFPAGMYNVSHMQGTQVFIYENDLADMKDNPSSSASALCAGRGVWVGGGANSVLTPETQFIVRNQAVTPLTVITQGVVPDYNVSMLIAPSGDLVIGSGYPVPVSLSAAGLEGLSRTVFFYDNSATGQNKSAIASALWIGTMWVGAGSGMTLMPSEVVKLRLPATEAGQKVTINKPYP